MKSNRFPATCGLLVWALAAAGPASPASRDRQEPFAITLPAPYSQVLDVVRAVCSDGVIHGTEQYDTEIGIPGAAAADQSHAFPQWNGAGEALYKARPKTIAPSHFTGSRDIGTVTLRYVVAPIASGQTQLTIEAVFVEDNRHGRHPSQGMVEAAEFAEIAKRLKQQTGKEDVRRPTEAVATPKN